MIGGTRGFYRMFHRIFDDGLAQTSFVVACDRTRLAAVVDPRRDIDIYVELARQRGLTLALVVETHVHADFVSGACELSSCGAMIVTGPGAGLGVPHREARHGEALPLGDLTLAALHTPGHTPEHISLLVEAPGEPARVLTGDTLFVGAVGRPDLLGHDVACDLARDLYVSIFEKLLTLDDNVEVHPGHGAGSLCGSGIAQEPHSTIGRERRLNPMLQHASRTAFVDAVMQDLPETPPYFAELKRLNQLGPPVLGLARRVPEAPGFTPAQAHGMVKQGAMMIDLRQADAFADGHPSGAINIGFGPKIGYWSGWVVPLATAVILVTDGAPRTIAEARRQLLRVGIGRVGFLEGGFAGWRAAGLPVARLPQIRVADVDGRDTHNRPMTILDVRSEHEFAAEHVSGAVHVPVGALPTRMREIPRGHPVATICEGGYRSSLAASLLARAGILPVFNVAGGMAAYRKMRAAIEPAFGKDFGGPP